MIFLLIQIFFFPYPKSGQRHLNFLLSPHTDGVRTVFEAATTNSCIFIWGLGSGSPSLGGFSASSAADLLMLKLNHLFTNPPASLPASLTPFLTCPPHQHPSPVPLTCQPRAPPHLSPHLPTSPTFLTCPPHLPTSPAFFTYLPSPTCFIQEQQP